MLLMSNNINGWLPKTGKSNLNMIICAIFTMNLLAATQDIVVDGWALTMLKKWAPNVFGFEYNFEIYDVNLIFEQEKRELCIHLQFLRSGDWTIFRFGVSDAALFRRIQKKIFSISTRHRRVDKFSK